MRKFIYIGFLISILPISLSAQNENAEKLDSVKSGWTFGALPVVAYDSDLGFKYGGFANFYYFGDGSTYPKYLHNIGIEISRTTKGSGINQLFFDSENVFKKPIRITADLSYLTEQALDFYGFNGSEAMYYSGFEDDVSAFYKSRMYYRHARELFRFTFDFQGNIIPGKLRWLAGYGNYTHNISSVDIEQLNKGKADEDKLPDVPSLYDEYVNIGIIGQKEADGGMVNLIKAGIIYDTRDNEACPMSGIWTELLFATAPRFLFNSEHPYTKLIFIHRQYFTLVKEKVSFAYRLGYQGTIDGQAPFYMQSLMLSSYSPSVIVEGLGGAKSLRGIMRNRIVGEGFAWGNFCLRWKFFRTRMFKQNFYVALNAFTDMGSVVQKHPIDYSLTTIEEKNDKIHLTYGGGMHFAMNENFVLSANYGLTPNLQDGKSGFYLGTSWLF
jgi:outer membrane protein assembly factor BamA